MVSFFTTSNIKVLALNNDNFMAGSSSSFKRIKLDSEGLLQEALTFINKGNAPLDMLCQSSSLLSSYQDVIKHRTDKHEMEKKKLQHDIQVLESSIVTVNRSIEVAEKQLRKTKHGYKEKYLKYKETLELDKRRDESKGNEECLIEVLRHDISNQLETKKKKLYENLEKTRKLEVYRMEKKIKEYIVNAKNNNQKVCLHCGAVRNELFMCTRCESVYYCNDLCQLQHWNVHQYYCVGK